MPLDTSELLEAVGGERQKPDESVIDKLRFDESIDVPVELTDAELWANYVNNDLYEMDKKVREFLKKTRWKRQTKGKYRTTASLVFAWIFGRQPEAGDGSVCRMLHELLRYYCSSYTGTTTFMGKRVTCVYEFSQYAFNHRRPYSLKLRLEENYGKDPWRKSCVDDSKKRRRGRRKDKEPGE